jgi:hypothetical protein
MPSRAITGWGGTLTLKLGSAVAKTIPVRNVNIERQASEFDMTALSDTRMFAGPGRVKRTGSFEAYISTETVDITTAIETINMASTALMVLTFTDSANTVTTMNIIITGANQTHSAEDAAIYSVTFSETIAAVTP